MRPLTIVCLIGLSAAISFQISSPLLSIYAKEYLNASIPEVGIIVSAFFIASAFSKLPIGMLVRSRATVLALMIGLFLVAIMPFFYVNLSAPYLLAFSRAVHGLGSAMYVTSALTFTALIVSPESRDSALAKYTAFVSVGLAFGPIVGSFCVTLLGVKGTIAFSIIPALLAFFLSTRFFKNPLTYKISIDDEKFSRRVFIKVLSNKAFEMAFFSYFAFSFIYSLTLAYVPIYAKESFGLGDREITLLFFEYFAFTALARALLNRAIDFFGRSKLLLIGLMNATLATLAIGLANVQWIFFFAFGLFGISHGIVYPTAAMIVAKAVKPEELFFTNSLYLSAFDLGGGFGPIAMAPLATKLGIPIALAISSLLPISAIIVLINCKRVFEKL
ncbi:MAG: MFS transporter [Candidatus Bathyarchaeia archaeon]